MHQVNLDQYLDNWDTLHRSSSYARFCFNAVIQCKAQAEDFDLCLKPLLELKKIKIVCLASGPANDALSCGLALKKLASFFGIEFTWSKLQFVCGQIPQLGINPSRHFSELGRFTY